MKCETPKARIALTTAATPEEARRLGRELVEERLAACATLVPGAESIYHWEGRIETAAETLLVLKTTSDKVEALEARLKDLHSYETPEFLVLEIERGSRAYLDWIEASLQAR
jgi:periplasmic divalent cation tolerance protein